MRTSFLTRSILIFLVSILFFQTAVSAGYVELNLDEGETAFTFFDLTHGEAMLVQNKQGETVLINTGHKNSREELRERLELYQADLVDKLILTGSQDEYAGNLQWVLENYDVEEIFLSEEMLKSSGPLTKRFQGKINTLEKGSQYTIMDGLQLDVLYVEENNEADKGGVVFFLQNNNKKLLFISLADIHVENELVREFDLKSTIFKVPDFASDRATSQKLLEEVDPQVAVIFRDGNEPPSSHVLERLEATWIDIYQTSRMGTVTIKCNEEDYDIITLKPSDTRDMLHAGWLHKLW
ncbi:hypothetical protein MM300_17440 [Evansella sp. LMS18]|uniref:ComEC/Rec2 family competence protein n=1 Tax=Evansella sp. LMS18 TaxID=2924033 RepID=UPI0020D0F6A3|nr:hypothetical protein [Evansella sp. LMS18]UTR09658.1 hypothetical protein MM300_17440 [Evansella sp. LMS18]